MSLPPSPGPHGPGKPPVGKPQPLPMSAPKSLPTTPVASSTPPVRKAKSGPSLGMILLGVFGGVAVVVLLGCGGLVWLIYTKAQQARRNLLEMQAQAQIDHQITPPTPNFNANFPTQRAIDSIPSALAAMDEVDHFRREEAANYLASQPVDASQREAVLAKAMPLLGDWNRREQGRRIVEQWATASDAPALLAAAQNAAARNDRDTQQIMMQLLAKTGDPRAVDAAVEYLSTQHDVAAARQVLASLDAASAPKLLPLYNHPSPGVRQTARELLAQHAIDELGIARQCLADLNSSETERQREAARWLAQHVLEDEELALQVSGALIQQLSNRQLRGEVAAALTQWATANDIARLVEAASAASAAHDREAQREIVQLLAKTKDPQALPALAEYLAAGHDIFGATNAFETYGPEAAETLLEFANHPNGSVQHFARQLLQKWEVAPAAYIGQSVKDLASADVNRQRVIANWLAQQEVDSEQQAEVAVALAPLLDDPSTRREAIRALRVWATGESVPKLLTLLDDEDQFFRGEVMQVLVAQKDPRIVPYVAAGFADDSSKRHEAARHLRALGPMAESALWPHTSSADWQVAMEACNVLKDIGTKRSLPALQLATQHANASVQFAAKSAIKEVEAAKRAVEPAQIAATDSPKAISRGMREWIDATGKNKIQAEFVEFASGKVKLRTKQGRTLALNMNQLSPEDRRYVIELMQNP